MVSSVCLSAFNNLVLCTSNATHEGSVVCWAVQCLPPASPATGRLGGHTGHGRGVMGMGVERGEREKRGGREDADIDRYWMQHVIHCRSGS